MSWNDCILYMQVVNTDTASFVQQMSYKILTVAERAKKHNYIDSCIQQRYHLPPFFVSVNGLLGAEA